MNTRIFVRFLVLGCVCAVVGVAQTTAPATSAKPRFAIEFPADKTSPPDFGPRYQTIPDYCNTVVCQSLPVRYGENLPRLANADPAIRQPSALVLEYKAEGDQVLITPVVYYGEIDAKAASIPLDTLEKQRLETYSGKLNDTITLSALAQVGLEPMTLKIVSAQSEHPYQPLTRSNAPSLDMEYAPLDRTSGTVTIHNRSSKAVVALRFGSPSDCKDRGDSHDSDSAGCPTDESSSDDCNDGWSEGVANGGLKDLIAPGASYQGPVSPGQSWKKVNGEMVEQPLPAYLTLEAVLFADGSYEGDVKAAAEMAANQDGKSAQRERILSVIKTNLADTQSDDVTKAGLIRAAVKQLTEEPDAQMIANFRSQFPSLSDSDFADAKNFLSIGMKNEKEGLDSAIKMNENLLASDSKPPKKYQMTLAQLLATIYVHDDQPGASSHPTN